MYRYVMVSLITALLFTSCRTEKIVREIPPCDDSYIWEWSYEDNTNYGDEGQFFVGRNGLPPILEDWMWLFGYRWHPERMRTVIRFDLSSYAPGITLDSAKVRLYIFYAYDDFPLDEMWVGICTEEWDESTVTWNNRPHHEEDWSPGEPVMGWWEIDVTDVAQRWIDGEIPNYGLMIGSSALWDDWFTAYSKEYSHQEVHPQLVLYYTGFSVEGDSVGSD